MENTEITNIKIEILAGNLIEDSSEKQMAFGGNYINMLDSELKKEYPNAFIDLQLLRGVTGAPIPMEIEGIEHVPQDIYDDVIFIKESVFNTLNN